MFAQHIKEKLAKYSESERNDVILLFSAHSLPMAVVNRGMRNGLFKVIHIQAKLLLLSIALVGLFFKRTVEKLKFSNPYRLGKKRNNSLVWQSQVGPSAWLGPKTDDAIQGYAKQGKKNLLVVPIAFVSDHIETLFELDLEYGEMAQKVIE